MSPLAILAREMETPEARRVRRTSRGEREERRLSRMPLGAKEPRSTGQFVSMANFTNKFHFSLYGPENGLKRRFGNFSQLKTAISSEAPPSLGG